MDSELKKRYNISGHWGSSFLVKPSGGGLALYLVKLSREFGQLLVAVIILVLCVAEMLSEDVPIADKGGKPPGQFLQPNPNRRGLLLDLQAV